MTCGTCQGSGFIYAKSLNGFKYDDNCKSTGIDACPECAGFAEAEFNGKKDDDK